MRSVAKFLVIAVLIASAAPCFAQSKAPPARLRGTIEKVDHDTLTVMTGMGPAMVVVTPKTRIQGVAAMKLSQVKANDFIGVTALETKDGKLHATEVHIFPAAMRGAGEGHYPMGAPNTTMTNAVVSGVVKSTGDESVALSYKDRKTGKPGAVMIDIGPTIPVVTFVPGDRSLLKPGASLVVFAGKKPDGTYIAFAIVAEKDGVKPPM
jgi:Domain of unknown function (DUF5666)